MKVLVVGSGGREHAMVRSISRSPLLKECFCAPGNGGTSQDARNVPIAADDVAGLTTFAKEKGIDLTIVGPEVPLVLGIVDSFKEAGLKVFGPNARAAELEGSKAFSKELMRKHKIPTAAFKSFNSADEALAYVTAPRNYPIVIKADGLAAGKGAIIVENVRDAENTVHRIMLDRVFGDAGNRLVIEEFMEGTEASVFCLVDGKTIDVLETAQDHKQIFDGGNGPNTGGMGAYSPSGLIQGKVYSQVEDQIIVPTVHAMEVEGRPFRGLLYFGLMITRSGPRILEYNVRGGDPEMQILLARLKSDFLEIALATTESRLDDLEQIEWDERPGVCVVMASGGYPDQYKTGIPITGIPEPEDDAWVIHAGTKAVGGEILTAGGRVLNVVALGETMARAKEKAYSIVEQIEFEGCHYRKDIGDRAFDTIPNTF